MFFFAADLADWDIFSIFADTNCAVDRIIGMQYAFGIGLTTSTQLNLSV